MIVLDEGRYMHTTAMERYLELSHQEKLSLWLSTLLHPNLVQAAPYFKEWPVGKWWAKLFDKKYLNSLLTVPQAADKKNRIQSLTAQLGQDLQLYRLVYAGEYQVDLTPLGDAVFRRIGALKKDNVVSLFG